MNIVIEPSPLKGEIAAIPSKSVAHRMLIAAALEMLAGKRESKPAKKHGNMPL